MQGSKDSQTSITTQSLLCAMAAAAVATQLSAKAMYVQQTFLEAVETQTSVTDNSEIE
jgi:hypothetical protein